MRKIIIVAAALATLSVFTGSVMAAVKVDKATAACEKLAKKNHITEDKMDSYMKSCVKKHKKSHKKVASAKPAPAAPAPAAEAPAAEAPAAGQ